MVDKNHDFFQKNKKMDFLELNQIFFIFIISSPGPGRQLLDGSISLKFLLETRIQSKSFNTLDNLLGFQVKKL